MELSKIETFNDFVGELKKFVEDIRNIFPWNYDAQTGAQVSFL